MIFNPVIQSSTVAHLMQPNCFLLLYHFYSLVFRIWLCWYFFYALSDVLGLHSSNIQRTSNMQKNTPSCIKNYRVNIVVIIRVAVFRPVLSCLENSNWNEPVDLHNSCNKSKSFSYDVVIFPIKHRNSRFWRKKMLM